MGVTELGRLRVVRGAAPPFQKHTVSIFSEKIFVHLRHDFLKPQHFHLRASCETDEYENKAPDQSKRSQPTQRVC